MIYGLHRKVEGHELTDRSESVEGGSDRQSGESHLRDRGVDHSLVAVLLPQAARNLKKTVQSLNVNCQYSTREKVIFKCNDRN